MARNDATSHRIVAATVVGVYGIKGWVKLRVNLEDPASLLSLHSHVLETAQGRDAKPVTVLQLRRQGKSHVALLEGVNDRTAAEGLRGATITVPTSSLPELAKGDFYWHDLVGCTVVTETDPALVQTLGEVDHLIETGANDVLVVRATPASLDDRERLIPFLEGDVVTSVDLGASVIRVRWHPDD